jgi:glycosyltransferase involved in cell wall biosynthesis
LTVRGLRVLQVTAVETANYHLTSLVDFVDPDAVRFVAVTLGRAGTFAAPLERRGVRVQALACPGRASYGRALAQLVRTLAEERIDLIHAHLFDPGLLSALLARYRRLPLVITRHHSDAVYRVKGRWRRAAYSHLEGFMNRSASRVIAPSQMVRSILVEREGVPPDRVDLVPYPQDPARFADLGDLERLRSELGTRPGKTLVCVSRLHPEKGHAVLLAAFRRLLAFEPEARLLLVGSGPELDVLQGLVARLDLQGRVSFLGWREDALSIVAAADVLVHASFHEALPSAVIEGLVLERPVVATDVSGVRDLIGQDEHGRLVPAGDEVALAAALREVLGNLPEARARAQRGRRHVLEYMDPRRVSEAHVSTYRRAMMQQRPMSSPQLVP